MKGRNDLQVSCAFLTKSIRVLEKSDTSILKAIIQNQSPFQLKGSSGNDGGEGILFTLFSVPSRTVCF